MALPTSRSTFKSWCLRKLGSPVIQINVDDDQVDDRIDEALSYFWDFSFDGSEKQYYKYLVTQTDVNNKYLTMPDNIIGAVSVFPIGSALSSTNLFNIRYQISLNDLYDLTATTMVPYYLAMQHIQFLEQLLVGHQPIRYNRYNNQLFIDTDWNTIQVGQYVVIEAYGVVDPTVYTKAWSDRWLMRYATALIKEQWGSNIGKYVDVSMPGGMKFNGEQIARSAREEVLKLEDEMQTTYSARPLDFIG